MLIVKPSDTLVLCVAELLDEVETFRLRESVEEALPGLAGIRVFSGVGQTQSFVYRPDTPAPTRVGVGDIAAESLALLDEILRTFYEKAHPGYPGVRTGYVREDRVQAWRDTAERLRAELEVMGG